MLYNIVLTFHVATCLILIVVVLMQSSKGGGLAGAFGGGGGDSTMFGGHETATFLNKATTYLATLFMLLSLSLAFLTSQRSENRPRSVIQQQLRDQGTTLPVGQSIDDILGTTEQDTVPPDPQPTDN